MIMEKLTMLIYYYMRSMVGFMMLVIARENKFKNPYAIWIWAASGKSLFGSALDMAWIFIFFFKNIEISKMIKEFGAFCGHVGGQRLRTVRLIRCAPVWRSAQPSCRDGRASRHGRFTEEAASIRAEPGRGPREQ